MVELMDINVPAGMTASLLKVEYAMEPIVPCKISNLVDGSLKDAGGKEGDRIISVNGEASGLLLSICCGHQPAKEYKF